MKELLLPPFQEYTRKGLRPNKRGLTNSPFLVRCNNAKPSEVGLILPTEIEQPFGLPFDMNFPFPQLFRGKVLSLVAEADVIHLVDEDGWTSVALPTFDTLEVDTERDVTGGGSWQFADLDDVWLLTNGVCTVFDAGLHLIDAEAYPDQVYVEDSFAIQSIAVHDEGRVLMGGFDEGYSHPVFGTLGPRWVTWSEIGGGDVLWPFFPERVPADLSEYRERNQAGAVAMLAHQGTIRNIVPFDKTPYVLVFCDHAVCVLNRYSSPESGYGIKTILGVGIMSRGALSVGRDKVLFLDETGYARLIGADLSIKELDYREFFSSFRNTPVLGAYDEVEDDLYISNTSSGYVLSKTGLGRVSHKPTSLSRYGGYEKLIGFYNDEALPLYVETETFDMGLRGDKTLQTVQVSYKDVENLTVRVAYSYDSGITWDTTPQLQLNSAGYCFPRITASEFRIIIEGNPGPNMNIDRIQVHYQVQDKRYIRTMHSGG